MDLRIVDELLKDSRRSFTEIAEKIGVSDTTVHNWYKRLVGEGFIRPTVLVDREITGFEFARIRVMKDVEETAKRFAGCPRVALMARMETGELVIWFAAEDRDVLESEIDRHFADAVVDTHPELAAPHFIQIRETPDLPKNRTPCNDFCTECEHFGNSCIGCPATVHFTARSRIQKTQ